MTHDARDAWVRDVLPRLAETLGDDRLPEGSRYSEAECRDLLGFLFDMDTDGRTGDLSPHELVLQKLIMMQGWDVATAGLLARVMPRLDWNRLEVASAATATILDVNLTTLMRNREAGNVPTKSEHWSRIRKESVIHWLSHILYILAWKRMHPWTGGPVSGFPPPERA